MKQQIENIIKKNFYKEFKGEIIESFRGGRHTDGSIDEHYDRNIDKEIQQIIPLIADEVLKVVVEKIERHKQDIIFLSKQTAFQDDKLQTIYKSQINCVEDVLQLLSNLSPNKENKK